MESNGLYAVGLVLDIEEKRKDKGKGAVWGKTIWLRCGRGTPLGFEVDKDVFVKRGSMVRLEYNDKVNDFGGVHVERYVYKDGIKVLNQAEEDPKEKKAAGVKI